MGAFGKMSGLSGRRFLSFPAPPPRSYFFAPFCAMPSRVFSAVVPLGLKETEKTAMQAMCCAVHQHHNVAALQGNFVIRAFK